MKDAEINTRLINTYFEFFRRLSEESQSAMIKKLGKSKSKKRENSFYSTFGAFEGSESADELIESIQKSRSFKRDRAEF